MSYTRNTDAALRPVAADRASTFVENIRFLFHLSVSRSMETGSVLEIKPTTSTSLTDEKVKETRGDLEKISVRAKMDHHISGWDFSNDNKKPSLFLKFGLHMGRTFDRSIINDISDPARSTYFGDPSIGIEYSDVPRKILWEESWERVLANKLDTSGSGDIGMLNGGRLLAKLFWNDEILEMNDAGGRTLRSNLQVHNLSVIGPLSKIWQSSHFRGRIGVGISAAGAYIYPRALNIHHDPGIETFGWRVIEKEDHIGDDDRFIPGVLTIEEASILLAVIAVAIMVAAAIIVSLTRRRLDPGDEELRREEEEEIFVVRTRKRDWDKLRPK